MQLGIIAANPTENQLTLVETTQPGQIIEGGNPREYANNTFSNFLTFKNDHEAAEARVKTARREALGAKPAEFADKKVSLNEAIDARRAAKAQLNAAVG